VIDSPYRGLSAFEEQDAAFFFGRETATTELLERMPGDLQGTGLLMVSGVSGAGKSSLLRAGVLPRIRGHRACEPGRQRRLIRTGGGAKNMDNPSPGPYH